MLDHSPTFVTRTLPSGCPRTDTLSSRAAAYKPERNRLRLRSFTVLARLLDAWTDVGVPQCDALLVAASGINNLPGRYGTVRVDPVAPPPTVGGGRVVNVLAVAV
jgi:hypothetical protein